MIRCLAPQGSLHQAVQICRGKDLFYEGGDPVSRHQLERSVMCDPRVAGNRKDTEPDIEFLTASPPMRL